MTRLHDRRLIADQASEAAVMSSQTMSQARPKWSSLPPGPDRLDPTEELVDQHASALWPVHGNWNASRIWAR